MRIQRILISVGIALSMVMSSSALAAVKSGDSCKKLGLTSTVKGVKYTCIKSGKNLVWSKGKAIPKPIVTPSPVPTPTKTPMPTVTPTPTPSPIKVSNISDYRPIKECELLNASQNNDVNQSHSPRVSFSVDTTKSIRILIFSVDFPDLVSPNQSSPDFKGMISQIENYYTSQSNGKIKFSWTVSPAFKRMSKTIDSYGVGSRAAGSVWQLNNDIQDLAFQTYKRDDFDVIFGSAPTTTTREQIASSPAFPTRDVRYKPATYLGGDYWSNQQSWTIPAHEFGHFALGLADLYDFKASMLGQSGFEQQFQHMGIYDIMNWAGGEGLEMSAWNRWVGKLIKDPQMICLPNSSTTTLLMPIEDTESEVKGLVLPVNSSSALVIENRAAVGFDKGLSSGAQGVIVYLVDTSIETGNGPMKLIRKSGSKDSLFRDNALKKGESVSYGVFTIKVVAESGLDKYVEVSKQG